MSAHIPRVSIGLPVYNGELYLRSALDSILSQDFADFELIISDNASTDATPDICREYAPGTRASAIITIRKTSGRAGITSGYSNWRAANSSSGLPTMMCICRGS